MSSPPATPAASPVAPRRAPLGLDRADLLLLAAFAAMSMAILAALATRPLSMTGAESGVVADQLQYFGWIRVASEHLVIHNIWDIDPEGTSYFVHPGFLASGLLHKLGLSIPLAYLVLWKPVAVALLFFGFRAYVNRLVPARGAALAALAIALFYVSPVAAAIDLLAIGDLDFRKELRFLAGEVFPGVYVWGYLMTAIAVGLVPFVLLALERAREPARRAAGRSGGWYASWAAAGGLLIAWLQPWQAVAVIGTVVVVELIDWRRHGARLGERLRGSGPMLVASTLPLVYYWILERVDPAWEIAGHANRKFELGWPPSVWLIGLLPLALPAALAYRRRPADWQELALRVLPLAFVGEYFLISVSGLGTFPFHSLQGLSLPLAILAVQGTAELRPAAWWRARAVPVAVALAALLALGVADRVNQIRIEIHKGGQPYLLHDGERAAFDYLEELPRAGGVLAPIYSGLMVPYQTGRETWVGQLSWTPHYHRRVARAGALFEGRMERVEARRFVAGTGARFLYADCLERADLTRTLQPYLAAVRRFGCATVYEVDRRALR
ncbi:MAG TPA: hypothetical protein VFQ12_08075 [Thermoleophilaceae bacterium]|nr:hypothetical protein [Thermoleophilaceae bacterium]